MADSITLDDYQVSQIRRALLIGLESFGEIERLQNAVAITKLCGKKLPAEIHPIHPTGDAATIAKFSFALLLLEGGRPPDQGDGPTRGR